MLPYSPPEFSSEISKFRTTISEERVIEAGSFASTAILDFPFHGLSGFAHPDAGLKDYMAFFIDPYKNAGISFLDRDSKPLGTAYPVLSTHARNTLGTNGLSRFKSFLANKDGWYFGGGKSLNSESVKQVNRFFEKVQIPASIRPSLFLTEDGNLSIGWENTVVGSINLEFEPGIVRYSFEKLDVEGASNLTEMVAKFGNLLTSE